jgi:hypothetical protein
MSYLLHERRNSWQCFAGLHRVFFVGSHDFFFHQHLTLPFPLPGKTTGYEYTSTHLYLCSIKLTVTSKVKCVCVMFVSLLVYAKRFHYGRGPARHQKDEGVCGGSVTVLPQLLEYYLLLCAAYSGQCFNFQIIALDNCGHLLQPLTTDVNRTPPPPPPGYCTWVGFVCKRIVVGVQYFYNWM